MEDILEGKSEAYCKGYLASGEGAKANENPYAAPSKEWYDWREGHVDGIPSEEFTEAFMKGMDARSHGFGYEHNPYKTHPERAEWIRGLQAGCLSEEGRENLELRRNQKTS